MLNSFMGTEVGLGSCNLHLVFVLEEKFLIIVSRYALVKLCDNQLIRITNPSMKI